MAGGAPTTTSVLKPATSSGIILPARTCSRQMGYGKDFFLAIPQHSPKEPCSIRLEFRRALQNFHSRLLSLAHSHRLTKRASIRQLHLTLCLPGLHLFTISLPSRDKELPK